MASVLSDVPRKYEENSDDLEQARIRFGPLEVGDGSAALGSLAQERRRRLLTHERSLSQTRSRFSLSDKVDPADVMPTAFKTISHHIEDPVSDSLDDAKARQFADLTWNTDSVREVAQKLSTDLTTGLSDKLVSEKVKIYGLNVQSPPPNRLLKKLFVYFFGGFGVLLFGGGILVIISWKPLGQPPAVANLILGIVLLVVFLFQGIFNLWQDFSSSRVMDSIHNMMPVECVVLRNGEVITMSAKDLVPGDVVYLKSGNKVPADMRICENSADLSFDRSVLTGESKPIPASTTPDNPSNSNYLESWCIAMQGTFVVNGSGKGVVVAIGNETIFGSIAKISSTEKKGLTPLQKEVLRFVIITTTIIVTLVVLMIILWATWLRHSYPDWINVPTLIVDLVSIAVAFMPEGLPIALTTCLVITANEMRKCNVLCKSLAVVETLGSVSVLCSDKTGTLTKNKMFVTEVSIGDSEITPEEDEKVSRGVSLLQTIAGVCNEAYFEKTETGERVTKGNATDIAVLNYVDEVVSVTDVVLPKWTKKGEVTFNSKNKFMVRLVEPVSQDSWEEIGTKADYDNYLLTVKGAPDTLLERCSSYFDNELSSVMTLDAAAKQRISEIQKRWSSGGKRVILLASKLVTKDEFSEPLLEDSTRSVEHLTAATEHGLTLVGLMGISDPPRERIPEMVQSLKDAGIKIVMITGDFELTALAIGKMCGIVDENSSGSDGVEHLDRNYVIEGVKKSQLPDVEHQIDRSIVVSGHSLGDLNDNQWDNLTNYSEIIFARTTPEQKLKIVMEFQKRKHIVGMVGDGINDAPSLKQADCGISMIDGSDLAKEASDLVMLNSIHSIIDALKFGRLVFENLKKTIAYLMPAGTYSELWPVLLNIIFGLPQALTSFNMIIICCVTDCIGAITLSYESSERNLLFKKPRVLTKERLVDAQLFLHSYFVIGTFYTFTSMAMAFLNFQRHGIRFSEMSMKYGSFEDLPHFDEIAAMSSSIYFINLVIMQFFNLFSIRTRYLSIFQHTPLKNPYMFAVPPIALAVTFLLNYIPAIQSSLLTNQVPVEYYFIAIGFGAIVMVYDELRKWYVRGHPKSLIAKLSW